VCLYDHSQSNWDGSHVKINRVTMTIADYSATFERGEITIDKTYQRSPKVWPAPARSYLIETILKEYPVPKLTLHQVTDLKSKRTTKKVVDGQQRSMAIIDFFRGDLRLSRRLELSEAAGRTYSELPEELQSTFLSYVLVFDQFESASEEDVREYFRRINSFTAPLNAEEQRHARFQGPMKWFIHDLSKDVADSLVALGVLSDRSVVRMADAKLLAELVHALTYGVATTSKTSLNAMYQQYDRGESVPNEDELREAVEQAIDTILGWPDLHTTPLMKAYNFYSLVLAIIRVRTAWPTLLSVVEEPTEPSPLASTSLENLLTLASALDDPDSYEEFKEFTDAAAERTNVKSQREVRVRWLTDALTNDSF
jgi:hypothetical protein